MRQLIAGFLVALAAVGGCGSAGGRQGAAEPGAEVVAAPSTSGSEFDLRFESVDLDTAFRIVGGATGETFVLDPASAWIVVCARLDLTPESRVTAEQVPALLTAALQELGLSTEKTPDGIVVRATPATPPPGCEGREPVPPRGPGGEGSGTDEEAPDCGDRGTGEEGCREACEAGDAAACVHLGEWLLDSELREDAREAFRLACAAGDVGSCCRAHLPASTVWWAGPREPPPAEVRACRAACDAGDAASCHRLSELLYDRDDRGTQYVEPSRRACDAGYLDACAPASLVSLGGPGVLIGESDAEVRARCEAGDPGRCFALGSYLYAEDRFDEATVPLGRACDAGHPRSCERYGFALARLGRDDDARSALTRGCDAGLASSCAKLGELLVAAHGFAEAEAAGRLACLSPARLCFFYGRLLEAAGRIDAVVGELDAACGGGDVVACLHLGGLLASESHSNQAALSAWRRACAGGIVDGCVEVGLWEGEPDLAEPEESEERLENVRTVVVGMCTDSDFQACTILLRAFTERIERFLPDEVEAVLGAACEDGQSVPCLALSWMLGRRDAHEEAAGAMERACGAAVPGTCGALGSLLLATGRAQEAEPLLRQACDEDDALRCTDLGTLLRGDGRLEAAATALERACSLDHAPACLLAAEVLVELGRAESAATSLNDACERGVLPACDAVANAEDGGSEDHDVEDD